ncbi:hypothetical protein PO455_24890, partial [Escherichia coli]
LPSETMIWQPEFTDKTLSRKPGAVQDHDTAEVKVQFGSSPVQALAMLRRVMTALEKQANAELNTNHYSRMQ